MKLLTSTHDDKITADNHLLEMNIGEYSKIAIEILKKNEFQRKRVKTANRIYSLLKDDIKIGCVIPPIVLAIFPKEELLMEAISVDNVVNKISNNGNDLIILDGLQRTYTILDLLSEVKEDFPLFSKINQLPLRIEIYTGISKVGVLYRMLTLNTGQTPMSTRHQVEILYSDYKSGFNDLVFISESDDRVPSGENEFKFSDIVDCFLSYITGDFLPIVSEDLVPIIKNLEALTKEDKQKDLFKLLINSYNKFRSKIDQLSLGWAFDISDGDLKKKPFATSVNELFSKGQFLAGYGAALSFLIEKGLMDNLEAVTANIWLIKKLDIQTALDNIVKHLDEIQVNAKKIGNEQRMYFYYLIRSLFNSSNDGYLDFEKAVAQAYFFYKANTLR